MKIHLKNHNSKNEVIQVENNFRHEKCPCCYSKNIEFIGIFDYLNVKKFSTCDVSFSYLPELWVCTDCQSWFIQNAIPEKQAQYLYSIGDASDRWGSESFRVSKTRKTVEYFNSTLAPGLRVLDVGANTGEFLDFAKKKGCQTCALEYSVNSCLMLSQKGHKTFQSFSEINQRFDVITGFDLIEHVYDVKEFIDKCSTILADQGKLVFLTGDNLSYSANRTLQYWWYIQYPEHVVFPSEKFFSNLSDYRLECYLKTYASRAHQINMDLRTGVRFIRSFINLMRRKPYNGQPSLTNDHALIVLAKKIRK